MLMSRLTIRISDPAPLPSDLKPRPYRGVHCTRLVRSHLQSVSICESSQDRAIYRGQRSASRQGHRHLRLVPKNFHNFAHTGCTARG
jgi:hypothetical protein